MKKFDVESLLFTSELCVRSERWSNTFVSICKIRICEVPHFNIDKVLLTLFIIKTLLPSSFVRIIETKRRWLRAITKVFVASFFQELYSQHGFCPLNDKLKDFKD